MKKITSIIFITLIAIFVLNCKKKEKDISLSFAGVIGDVKHISNAVEKTPGIEDTIKEGDTIITGDLSIADLLLGDQGLIRIYQNSNVKIASLISKMKNETQIDMDNGKLYGTLSKLKKSTFKVKTPTVVASIRGTSFRVTADKNKSRLDVLKGTVKINPVKDDRIIEEVEKVVEKSQTVEIDVKAVRKIVKAVKEKKEKDIEVIKVIALKPEEIKEIKEEIKDIKPEIVEKLDKEAKKEIKEEILEIKEDKDDSARAEEEERLEREKDKELQEKERHRELALKKMKENKRREREKQEIEKKNREKERIERERKEKERIARELKEKERKEKEKRERASNIPTL